MVNVGRRRELPHWHTDNCRFLTTADGTPFLTRKIPPSWAACCLVARTAKTREKPPITLPLLLGFLIKHSGAFLRRCEENKMMKKSRGILAGI